MTECKKSLTAVSYNMHGFYQGSPVLDDLVASKDPDVIMVQEHWLTPMKLCLFDSRFANYFSFGCSAMAGQLESGMLRGRPYGGVMTLIKTDLRKMTTTIYCDERFVIVKILNCLFINVYLPCVGSSDRSVICNDVLDNILSWMSRYQGCECVIAGDFNVNLDGNDALTLRINSLMNDCSLARCDDIVPSQKVNTYVNHSLKQESCIDYILVSKECYVNNFVVLDPDVNFSDHLPLMVNFSLSHLSDASSERLCKSSNRLASRQLQLRWDKADGNSYYHYTGHNLEPLLCIVDSVSSAYQAGNVSIDNICDCIESVYCSVVSTLQTAANMFVPKCRKGYFKFWWDEELRTLKDAAIDSNKIWKDAGKPRHGPIFLRRQSCKSQYRKRIREKEKAESKTYTNDLHDALMLKNNTAFWQCWRSKFELRSKCSQVYGCVDPEIIADKFVQHFKTNISCNNTHKAEVLKQSYLTLRATYCGLPITESYKFDTELVSRIITELKRGKALDIDGLSAEHLQFCHPVLSVILQKLFNLMILCSFVPDGFRYSYCTDTEN